MQRLTILLLLIGFSHYLKAQIAGQVTDSKGEPLSYVNVYLKNTSNGTTTNLDGYYELNLTPGKYDLVFQYVGYQTITKAVSIEKNGFQKLNVSLHIQQYQMDEVVIAADAEDPAYAIIRKAQAKRQFYKDQLSNYECDVYMRGFNKITSAPEKIMGIDIGDMEGTLDSTRQGIVYLSESVSKLYTRNGKQKEIMSSSKVSGEPRGYSFNSAKEMEYSFYDNSVELNRDMVSPIATNAMSHYKYKLEGVQYEAKGITVNKIKVIPKNKFGNVFFGHLYIIEDFWNIHSVDLSLSKEATQLAFVDTINFKQVYAPILDNKWVPLSNVIKFKIGAMGFNLEGSFAAVYSKYNIGEVPESVFSKEVYKVLEEANLHDERYWDSIRPMPLTHEEQLDYKVKDSIRIVKESPAYLDSIDRQANAFKPWSLLTGYTQQNSVKKSSVSYSSPISSIRLNSIQGWHSSANITGRKYYNDLRTKLFKVGADLNYGLSEKKFRATAFAEYIDDRFDDIRYRIEGGKKLSQYSRQDPIPEGLNSIFTLLFKNNFLKAYDKEYISLSLARDLGNTIYVRTSIDYENRNPLVNHYNVSETKFTSNNPQLPFSDAPAFDPHQALIFRLSLRFQFGREIWSHPYQTFKTPSKWPILDVYYKGGLNALGSDVDYHVLYASLSKRFDAGIYGDGYGRLMGGGFLGNSPEEFIDYFHFLGNQTHVANAQDRNRFFLLPYYSHSASKGFVQGHFQHKFRGYLLSKVPLLKKTQWQLVGGYKFLKSNTQAYYDEIHIGLDNVGFGIARLFRVDAVWAHDHFDCGEFADCVSGFKFGVVLSSAIMF